MKIRELTSFLEQIAPSRLQESYDNSGFIVGNPDAEIAGVLCCLDSTEAVVDEAIEKGCNLIVAHHPIIFNGLKSLTGQHYVERVVIKAIRNDITIYAIHTNLDNVVIDGVNAKIAQKLGLEVVHSLRPKEGKFENSSSKIQLSETLNSFLHDLNASSQIGSGIIGVLPEPMEEMKFLMHVKQSMNCGCIKYTPLLNRKVSKIAICGGSGQFLLKDAINAQADVFISSDFKYHEYFEADGKILIADVGHFESEQFTAELLCDIITENFSNFAAHISKTITNPIKYLV